MLSVTMEKIILRFKAIAMKKILYLEKPSCFLVYHLEKRGDTGEDSGELCPFAYVYI